MEGISTSKSTTLAPPQRGNNAKVYRKPGTAAHYGGETLLTRAEAIALLKYQPAFAGKDILDIGVGTGRTTIYLAALARHYQAVDYSPAMVSRFRESFPEVPVALADMTDLHAFDDANFDFVLASNNVFDAVGHEDRLRTLREIHRLLRHDGILMFSTHNRDVRNVMQGPRLAVSRNPITQLLFVAHWGISLFNHARLKKLQMSTDGYAIINDNAHHWAMLHYYISLNEQIRQLAAEGFRLIEVFDQTGKPVAPGERATDSRSLLYVAQRTTAN
jgi:SAM-dependent methyltransferase